MKYLVLLVLILGSSSLLLAQKDDKQKRYFGSPIVTDSTSAVMIPVRYNTDVISIGKLALSSSYYANIIFYDFKTDTSKRLFKEDTFIKGFDEPAYNYRFNTTNNNNIKNSITARWIFFFVRETDTNKDGKIDLDDPAVLYVTDKKGNALKAITATDHAVEIDVFDKQGFALIKMQRDVNNDRKFDAKDKDFYYIRLDLNTLALGNAIELK